MRLFVILLLLTPFAANSAENAEIHGSYFAVIVNDIDGSSSWYQAVFGLEQVSRSKEEGQYEIINLAGPGIFVELLQLPRAGERPGGQTKGPFKVGLLVQDIESFAAMLPAAVSPANIVFDQTNNLLFLQLRDPDDNMVQVMQLLEE
jgi:catechol-2,3-dioxygenase